LVALVVTFISTIVAGSFMSLTIYESRHSVWQKRRAQSLFLAEAGVEHTLYYLNNDDSPEDSYDGSLANGSYETTLYSPEEMSWLPENSYLIKSTGTLTRTNAADTKRRVSCIVRQLDGVPIPGAITIFDNADNETELVQFDSVEWTVDGRDMDSEGGVPGIAIANLALSQPGVVDANGDLVGDELLDQLGVRVGQVTGREQVVPATDPPTYIDTVGIDAILEDPDLPKNLDAYADYFEKIAIDISGMGSIPKDLLGSYDYPNVLYANLSEGPIRLLPNQPGYGVLVLDGKGDFKLSDVSMEGGGEWFGVVICGRDSEINLNGGGNSASHIYGALLVANGTVTMNGTADIVYSSDNVNNVNLKLLLYQVYSWCDGWGHELGSGEYYPIEEPDPIILW
ncbi:hypothetical protein ACFL6S_09870, partial [Candidatus Poribacteria bacterium]